MSERAFRMGAVGVYALLALSMFTHAYDPLPDLPLGVGVALVAAPHLGLGLAVPRWWAVAVPPTVALPWAIRGGDDGNALSFELAPVDILGLAAAGATLVLAGVLAATSDNAVRRAWASAGAVLVAVPLVPLGWSVLRTVHPADDRPGRPLLVDARAGALSGAGLGHSISEVTAAFGPGTPSATAPIAPLGENFPDLAAPPYIETPGETHAVLRYRAASFLLSDGRVYAIVVTSANAETRDGVGIGDNLALVRSEYPELDCGTGSRDADRTFPYCAGRLANGRYAWFGDDPIRSITLASTKLEELGSGSSTGNAGRVEVVLAASPSR